MYQSRLVLGVLIALVYGGTYSHLPYTFQGLQERLSLLFIVSAVLPLLTLGALPTFAHNDKVQLLTEDTSDDSYRGIDNNHYHSSSHNNDKPHHQV